MKKRVLCLLLSFCMCLSLSLFAQAIEPIDGPINADDDAELVGGLLEPSLAPQGAVAVGRNLSTGAITYYRLSAAAVALSEEVGYSVSGWMPDSIMSTNDGLSPDYVVDGESRVLVSNTQVSPYSAVCLMMSQYCDSQGYFIYNSMASAAMISNNVALTAAHCLYHESYGWASYLYLMPGVSGAAQSMNIPYGVAVATEIIVSLPYYESGGEDLTHDWGVIRLSRDIGNSSGYLGFQFKSNNLKDYTVTHIGYPGDLNGHSGGENDTMDSYNQYQDTASIILDTWGTTVASNGISLEYRELANGLDIMDGQSGGPVLCRGSSQDAYQIVGVNSAEFSASRSYACGITSQMFSFILAYKNSV